MATHTAPTGTSEQALEELQAKLRGPVLGATDPGLADVRAVFNAMHAGTPDRDRPAHRHGRRGGRGQVRARAAA